MAVNVRDGRAVAVGLEAKRMIGRTPSHIQAIRPLKDGVIADFEVCEKMLRYFIHKVHRSRWAKPRMVICVPSGITGVEQRAVQEAAEYAGARKPAYIIEEPMAAAIGAGLPVQEPTGNMIVDIGGGTTEVAVISLGGIVASQSVRVGRRRARRRHHPVRQEGVLAGARRAHRRGDQDGPRLGLAPRGGAHRRDPRPRPRHRPAQDRSSSPPRRSARPSRSPSSAIVDAVKATLDKTPPELAADIMEQGIMLTGGGALLTGLDARLEHETGMPIHIAANPLQSVAIGSGQALEEFDALRGVLFRGQDR